MTAMPTPSPVTPEWKTYRIVPSHFPPIDVFERILDPEELELAFEIEGMTNERLLEEAGHLKRVPAEDRVCGPGSSPVMAAFTHIGMASRFTDGSYGVYYAGSSLDVAIKETVFHRERYLAAANEPSMELTMRVYIGSVALPMLDIRGPEFTALYNPNPAEYGISQTAAAGWRAGGANGLLYRSVRCPDGECIAAFRPRAVTIPMHGSHLRYVWDGKAKRITDTFEISNPKHLCR